MANRSGIGASLATAFILSILLLSNYIVLVGADQRQALSLKVDEESFLADNSYVLSGSEVLSLLDKAQFVLSSAPIPCDTFSDALSRRLDNLSTFQSAGPLKVKASLAVIRNDLGDVTMRASMLSIGASKDLLDFTASVTSSANESPLGVSFNTKSFSIVTLPVRVDAIASACSHYRQIVSSALERAEINGCNISEISIAMRDVDGHLAEVSKDLGLTSSAMLTAISTSPCIARYAFTISQTSISGPLGLFTVVAEGGASVSRQG